MARKKSRRIPKTTQSKDGEVKTRVEPKSNSEKLKVTFWRRFVKALPLILLALLFTFILNRAGLFAELETAFLDIQMKMAMPDEESHIVIVEIGQEDFDGLFKGQRSPLNPPVLQQLLEAVADGGPCVVGVDIDTSFGQFEKFDVDRLSNFVWSRSAELNPAIVPLKVLGRNDPALDQRSGLPITKSDKGVTRFYSRMIKTTEGELPSFAWAVFNEAKERKCPGITFPSLEETSEPLIVGFSRGADGIGRTKISAGHLMKLAEGKWPNKSLIKDKIVLVGGSFLNEDIRDTPLGMMNGFAINANIVETELRGGGVQPPRVLSLILLQIFDGVLLMALFQLFVWRKAALLSLPFILVLSLACSFFTYYSFAQWLFFAPVMIGVLLTELFDKAKDHFKNKYKREITETYQELSGLTGEEKNLPVED